MHGDNSSNTTSPAAEVPRVTPPEYFAEAPTSSTTAAVAPTSCTTAAVAPTSSTMPPEALTSSTKPPEAVSPCIAAGHDDAKPDGDGHIVCSQYEDQNQGSTTQRAIPPVLIYPRYGWP